jgi:hypothetical protein
VMRAWMGVAAAAVVALTGCGAGDGGAPTTGTPISEPAASSGTGSASPATSAAGGASLNAAVRETCQASITERLAGAEFPTGGTLRAAASGGGKVFTISGTAQAGGVPHPYTCEIGVVDDEMTVSTVTVDGQ